MVNFERYFAIVEAIATGYSLIVLLLSSKNLFWRLVVVLDAVIKGIFHVFLVNFHAIQSLILVKGLHFVICDVQVAVVILSSSISAALALAHVGKKGNSHAGWLPICRQVPKFCDHVTGALIAGFIAAFLYLVLLVYTVYTALNPLFVEKP